MDANERGCGRMRFEVMGSQDGSACVLVGQTSVSAAARLYRQECLRRMRVLTDSWVIHIALIRVNSHPYVVENRIRLL